MYGLLGLMIAVLVIGLVWSGLSRHANELGAKRIADFCFSSCLQPDHNILCYNVKFAIVCWFIHAIVTTSRYGYVA